VGRKRTLEDLSYKQTNQSQAYALEPLDYTATRPTVNLAARVETACKPGSVFGSQEVRQHFHEDMPTDLAGEFELKGKTSLYKVMGSLKLGFNCLSNH
jgi:class 3 adenylate cyclase